MTMKEAAKTSVISRRWQKLPCLHFDGSQALLKLWEKVYEYWVCKLKKILDLEMARYVNIILKSCHLFGAAIDEFIVRFDIRENDDESLLILSSLINACPVSYMLSLE
ncbi:hypothetical protein Goklo_006146, partial [Gossypium klotzschianum]|nr:hypothetical protein [Gossypium klotzschianum]